MHEPQIGLAKAEAVFKGHSNVPLQSPSTPPPSSSGLTRGSNHERRWYREWKIELIEKMNPDWRDLYFQLW
ncbi:hypothetical protein GOA63_19925 [Sinorhizobium meliloti]|nr:hypothetical protein [Sinorhizobium meliloti]MDX0190280.1 hypothetical protein [Sinorhizobium meliloti]MQV08630.1 hypothetical protein [Sinorhizobium meliloti]MQV57756.1 hypothetical protein [Sinorhizobium meliloti]